MESRWSFSFWFFMNIVFTFTCQCYFHTQREISRYISCSGKGNCSDRGAADCKIHVADWHIFFYCLNIACSVAWNAVLLALHGCRGSTTLPGEATKRLGLSFVSWVWQSGFCKQILFAFFLLQFPLPPTYQKVFKFHFFFKLSKIQLTWLLST